MNSVPSTTVSNITPDQQFEGALLRDGPRDAHHSDQSQWSLSGEHVRFLAGIDSRSGY